MRALIFGLMGNGMSIIKNPLSSFDVEALLQACLNLGASFSKSVNEIKIEGLRGRICGSEDIIQAGNSGIILRFLAALAALSPHAS